MKNEKVKVYLYTRVSTLMQIDGYSLDAQKLYIKSVESIQFFKIVQNKLHYAAHGHTSAEVIYERADANKPFMGLTSFSGELPALKYFQMI